MRVRIAIAGVVIGTTAGVAISRTARWWKAWGVDGIERAKALPGDELVPDPTVIDTRGITIDAPPEAVWPWLVQMGYGRAGWYSYDRMDMRGTSAEGIVPAWQAIAVGDTIPNAPGTGFAVRIVEPGRALSLYADTDLVASQAAAVDPGSTSTTPAGLAASGAILRQTPEDFAASWTFVLEPLEGGRTRFIERFRVRFGAGNRAFGVVAPAMGFGVFLMMRRQMLGIRDRALRTVVVSTPTSTDPIQAASRPQANGHTGNRGLDTELVASVT